MNANFRFGTGSQVLLDANGDLEQPFVFVSGVWRKLTYSTQGMNSAVKVSGVMMDLSTSVVNAGDLTDGTGTITAVTDHTSGSATLQLLRLYTLNAGSQTAVITFTLSASSGAFGDVKMWFDVGDDWIGTNDRPSKLVGNLQSDGTFTDASDTTGNAPKITSGSEDVFMYSLDDAARTIVSGCCSFNNVANKDHEATYSSAVTNDGSYGMYNVCDKPSSQPSVAPSSQSSAQPSARPSENPSSQPSVAPSSQPCDEPSP